MDVDGQGNHMFEAEQYRNLNHSHAFCRNELNYPVVLQNCCRPQNYLRLSSCSQLRAQGIPTASHITYYTIDFKRHSIDLRIRCSHVCRLTEVCCKALWWSSFLGRPVLPWSLLGPVVLSFTRSRQGFGNIPGQPGAVAGGKSFRDRTDLHHANVPSQTLDNQGYFSDLQASKYSEKGPLSDSPGPLYTTSRGCVGTPKLRLGQLLLIHPWRLEAPAQLLAQLTGEEVNMELTHKMVHCWHHASQSVELRGWGARGETSPGARRHLRMRSLFFSSFPGGMGA